MSLHDRIMGIATHQKVEGFDSSEEARDVIQVRNEAAQIAKEADELMSEMAELIDDYKLIMQEMGVKPNRTDVLLDKYYVWKEPAK